MADRKKSVVKKDSNVVSGSGKISVAPINRIKVLSIGPGKKKYSLERNTYCW
jgi:hypothetical protein